VTPAARQRATFKEYRRANARPVVNGIFFYVKYDTFAHYSSPASTHGLKFKIMPHELKSQ
jgi:hypothetical protein